MKFNRKDLTDQRLQTIYEALLKPRMIEEKMLILLRQGKISKWFSGIGQEAISVGAALAMENDEYILPMHRNLGVFTSRNVPLERLFSQFQGKLSGFSKGRDRSFHFGTKEHHLVGMISHLGPQLAVADGIALGNLMEGIKKATLVFTGDGGTSQGDFHEAVNVASVWDLPVIFIIENNGYGLSTPSSEQFNFKSFTDKASGYGIDALQVDGNNVLEIYDVIQQTTKNIKANPRPVLIEALTFRMRGHEEASGTKYVPQELFEKWSKKDPIKNFEIYLVQESILDKQKINKIAKKIQKEIEQALGVAFAEKLPDPNAQQELDDMYAPEPEIKIAVNKSTQSMRFVDAISEAIRLGMEKYPRSILMGQDVAEYGGVFKITEGMVDLFGKDRIRNTPLCESAIIGMGLGLSIVDYKSIIEMQFADFVTCGFNQIINNLAKSHYRWGQKADVVIRMPTGGGIGAGPFHSQSNEAWFFHTPGLKVVYPSNPYDAKGLLLSALSDPNPVLYFEHKALYRSLTQKVPEGYYTCPIGRANLLLEGTDMSIITYGMGVVWAQEFLDDHPEIKADLIDLRSLLPWDQEAVAATVQKTGKVLLLHEDCLTGGIGGEIAAWIAEHCFEYLDAPIARLASLDTAVPFSPNLEENFLPKGRIKDKIRELMAY